MYKQFVSNTSFSYGEISPILFGRGYFDAYKYAAMTILNMDVIQTGGIKRRDGLRFIDHLPSRAKLIPFEYSAEDFFLLCFMDLSLYIYDKNYKMIACLTSPYSYQHLCNIKWVQKGNQLYIVHKDVEPKVLKYYPLEDKWLFDDWNFVIKENGASAQPFNRFDDVKDISITPSGLEGEISLTASHDLFDESFNDIKLFLNSGEVEIFEIETPLKAKAVVKSKLANMETSYDWKEQAFSHKRGFPNSITFHQNRLVIGGAKSLPNRLWFSKTADYFNFDLGEGRDDEAIEFDMLSDKVNEIVCVFSGKHLQVFTSDSEWMVSGYPLSPSQVVLKQQTKIGSISDRFLPPKLVEGSTIFVAKNNKEIREFFYGDINDSYSSEDLILFSSHMMNKPLEQDYDTSNRHLYILQSDGSISVLLKNKITGFNAWFRYNTDGEFISLSVLAGRLHVVVKRDDKYCLEVFDDTLFSDSATEFFFDVGIDTLTGLSRFEGKSVCINCDDYVFESIVMGGKVDLPITSKHIIVGIPYMHLFAPLPLLVSGVKPPKLLRLFDICFRVIDTPLLQVDTGDGLRSLTCLDFDRDNILNQSIPLFNGDIHIKAKGLVRNFELPLWKIQSSKPYNLTILNISYIVGIVR